jgi:hypothetical protein
MLRSTRRSWRQVTRGAALSALVLASLAAAGAGVAESRPTDVLAALAVVALLCVLIVAGRYIAAAPAMASRTGTDRFATWAGISAVTLSSAEAVRLTSSISVADAMLVVAAVALSLRYSVERRPKPVIPRALLYAASLFVISGLATASSSASRSDLLQLSQFVLAMVGTTIIVGWALRDAELAARTADAWATGAAVSSLVAATDFLLHTGLGAHVSGATFAGREAGLTLQPNDLGVTAALVVPWVAVRLVTSTSFRGTVWWSFVVGILSAGILVSGSRSALIAVPAGLLALLLVGRGVSRRLLPVIMGGGAVAGLAAIGARFSGSSSFVAINRLTGTSVSVAQSDSTRVARYHVAIADFTSHPIAGVGYQAIRQALDIYLQLASSGGLLALAGFGIFVFWIIGTQRALVRATHPGRLRNLGAALAGSMTVWLVYGLFQNGIYERYLYVAAGLTVAAGYSWLRRPAEGGAGGDPTEPSLAARSVRSGGAL